MKFGSESSAAKPEQMLSKVRYEARKTTAARLGLSRLAAMLPSAANAPLDGSKFGTKPVVVNKCVQPRSLGKDQFCRPMSDVSLTGLQVARELDRIAELGGYPGMIYQRQRHRAHLKHYPRLAATAWGRTGTTLRLANRCRMASSTASMAG